MKKYIIIFLSFLVIALASCAIRTLGVVGVPALPQAVWFIRRVLDGDSGQAHKCIGAKTAAC